MQALQTAEAIKQEIEVLVRNVTGRKSLTAGECDIVSSSIVDAYQIVLLEYGIDNFRFNNSSITVDTVSGQNYVDLDEYAFKVINGSVRIASQEALLTLIDDIAIYQLDPDLSQTGLPTQYAYIASDDPDVVRLLLWPIPDGVYTVSLNVLVYPTDAITEFPTSLMSAIKNKAKSIAVVGLGLSQLKIGFGALYEEVIEKVKDGFEYDGPRHIARRRLVSRPLFTNED